VNVLLLNLKTDVTDTTLGFTTSWINALAQLCDRVTVVTLEAGEAPTADNVEVHALARAGSSSKARKLLAFYRVAGRLARSSRVDVCFAHMTPLLAILFAPLARLYGIPVLLWYAHGSSSLQLRLAHRLVDRCITSTPAGFPIASRKLFVLGQGIDTERFVPPSSPPPDYGRTLLSIARMTPRKRTHEIVEAIAKLRSDRGEPVRLVAVGGPITNEDREYERRLRERIADLGVEDAVELEGAVPFHHVADVYRLCSVLVNVSETGSLDKAILEAMASGCIPVSRNRSFAAIARQEGLDWLVPADGAEALAACIQRVLELPKSERDPLRARLRSIVVRDHSLETLSKQIGRHLEELVSARNRRRSAKVVLRG
jgi:glycosyltransferase involved in cell wall biosynthesis